MTQTKIGSLIESFINVAIGYCVAITSQLIIFPIFDIYVNLKTNLYIGAWFTCVSIARSYIIRRWFNKKLHEASIRLSKEIERQRQ